ncbi:MAG TPA: hypothetical protein DCZ75_05305 [Geobacter sp.]|nr:hypothetical protein [Geobacter sp.]
MNDLFGHIVYSYTRADAINDGVLIDLSERYPEQCGMYRFPVGCTAAVWSLIEHGVAADTGATPAGIVWDILYMSQNYMVARPDEQTVFFDVIIPDARRSKVHRLKAVCHPGDKMEPVITVMLPEED